VLIAGSVEFQCSSELQQYTLPYLQIAVLSKMAHNILVFGGSGTIGKYIVRELLNDRGSFGKITVVTYPESYESKKDLFQKAKDLGAEVAVINIDDENAIRELYKGTYCDGHESLPALTIL
jgi:FlaA1/EpsC-like NDP-sugar epimerase